MHFGDSQAEVEQDESCQEGGDVPELQCEATKQQADQRVVREFQGPGPLVERFSSREASGNVGTDCLLHDQASRVGKIVKDGILVITPLAYHGFRPGITYAKEEPSGKCRCETSKHVQLRTGACAGRLIFISPCSQNYRA